MDNRWARLLAVGLTVCLFASGTAGAQQAAVEQKPALSPRVQVKVPEAVRGRLDELGFVVAPGGWTGDVAKLYRLWKHQHYPVVVTTDAALHAWHLRADWYQRFLEIAYLRGDLVGLTDSLIAKMMEYHERHERQDVREAALLGASYLLVGKRLLTGGGTDGAPEPWKGRIEGELKLIAEAAAIAPSPLFGYREDYTQYRPRGHYARSEEFASYFRAMMWLGRMKFRLQAEDEAVARTQTQAAMLLCRALWSAEVKGEKALEVWRRIYETTALFAGRSDDLLPTDYAELGAQFSILDPLTEGLDHFIKMAAQLRKPRVVGTAVPSSVTAGGPDWRQSTQGMTLFGQRYALDTEVMQRLVFDAVGKYQRGWAGEWAFTLVDAGGMLIRGFPRGLDVMAALGFAEADRILKEGGDDAYEGYADNMATLRKLVAEMGPEAWGSDLYVLRLRALAGLARTPQGRLPKAMQTAEWSLKQLAAALGSWTELKHDTILYTKQPYAMEQMALAGLAKNGAQPPPPPPPRGYVEPMPQVYEAIRAGAELLRTRLKELRFPQDQALDRGLERFAQDIQTLQRISEKELVGEALTDQEFSFIENIGHAFAMPEYGLPHHRDVTEPFQTAMDNLMPIVADVFTDPNSRMVLQEAVGQPMTLYMVCPVDGEQTVCLGVVYSYYEFRQPMRQRLTDDEWREMLTERKAPSMAAWMKAAYVVE